MQRRNQTRTFAIDRGWFLVTFVTRHRRRCLGYLDGPRFVAHPLGALVIEAWEWTCEGPMHVRSLVVQPMPEHVHGVVCMDGAASPLDRFVAAVKGRTTRRAREEGVIGTSIKL